MPADRVMVDANLAIKWIVSETGSDKAKTMRREWIQNGVLLLAPDLILLEIANALWKKVERGMIKRDAPVFSVPIEKLVPLDLVSSRGLVPPAQKISLDFHLSVYDAIYVAAAIKYQCPLFTADQKLMDKIPPGEVEIKILENIE